MINHNCTKYQIHCHIKYILINSNKFINSDEIYTIDKKLLHVLIPAYIRYLNEMNYIGDICTTGYSGYVYFRVLNISNITLAEERLINISKFRIYEYLKKHHFTIKPILYYYD